MKNTSSTDTNTPNLTNGQLEPSLNKTIKEIILKDDDYIVFLDEDNGIQWVIYRPIDPIPDFGKVMNEVRYLETINESLFKNEKLRKFNGLVAEGVARMLDDRDTKNAVNVLDQAKKMIFNQGVQKHRINYVLASAFGSIAVASLLFFLFQCDHLGKLSHNSYLILTSSLFGGIGAFISAFFRSQSYKPDVSIKTSIHILDGFLRIFYGIIAGTLVALGVISNIIFGFLNSETSDATSSHTVIAFLCLIAGASEFLIPNLINQIEGKAKIE